MSEVVFTTVHGSRLYGFDHAGSDHDYYTVTTATSDKVVHKIETINGRVIDTATVGIDHFLELAKSGSHQSVEALFSTRKVPGRAWVQYGPMLSDMYIQGPEVYDKYKRTITKFAFGDFKRRRHAVRLKHGLTFLRSTGRLNPTLSTQHVEWCNELAEKYEGTGLLGMLGLIREE